MTTTCWTLAWDFLEEKSVEITGPSGCTMHHLEIIDQGRPIRMKDADGILYYEGFVVGDDILAPLHDYGTPAAGCTTLEELVDGKWKAV